MALQRLRAGNEVVRHGKRLGIAEFQSEWDSNRKMSKREGRSTSQQLVPYDPCDEVEILYFPLNGLLSSEFSRAKRLY